MASIPFAYDVARESRTQGRTAPVLTYPKGTVVRGRPCDDGAGPLRVRQVLSADTPPVPFWLLPPSKVLMQLLANPAAAAQLARYPEDLPRRSNVTEFWQARSRQKGGDWACADVRARTHHYEA